MNRADLLATVERLCDIDLDTLERNELADVVASAARMRGWLDALDLRCTRYGRTLADAGRAEPAADMIAAHSNRSSREANQITRRGAVADAMPGFEDSLGEGTVSAGHLDAIANATRNAPPEVRSAFAMHDDELLTHAKTDTIETFTRRCRALVAQLTAELTGDDVAELDRQRAASRIRRWLDPDNGMHHTDISLDPVRDEMMWNAINRTLRSLQQRHGNARTPWNQLKVDALMERVVGGVGTTPATAPDPNPTASATTAPRSAPTATSPTNNPTTEPAEATGTAGRKTARGTHPDAEPAPSPAADIARNLAAAIAASMPANRDPGPDTSPDPDPGTHCCGPQPIDRQFTQVTEVSVLVDLATLLDGLHSHSVCETDNGIALPVSTVRRLCCDAEIIPVVLAGNGETLDVGRSKRTVNRAQRRALRAMHRTCAHPHCTVAFSDCKIHHVTWWWRDRGPTDINNLLPLCEHHHHLVHEGGWTLTMAQHRVATWTRPDGTIHHQGTTIDRQPGGLRSPTPPAAPAAAPPPAASAARAAANRARAG